MSYRSCLFNTQIAEVIQLMLHDHEAVIVTKNTNLPGFRFNVQGLDSIKAAVIEEAMDPTPKYSVVHVMNSRFPNHPQYAVHRTCGAKRTRIANFVVERDANDFAERRNRAAHEEVELRYESHRHGGGYGVFDTFAKRGGSHRIAMFSFDREQESKDYAAWLNSKEKKA